MTVLKIKEWSGMMLKKRQNGIRSCKRKQVNIQAKGTLGICCAGMFIFLGSLSASVQATETVKPLVPVRIGWQIPAATQGQIAQVLKRTNVLEIHGLEPTLVAFSYGRPEVDAAFAGELDVFLAGDQPAIDLILRGGKWKIVARLHHDRIAVMVPPESTIQKIDGLRGKTVAMPFGSIAHREAILAQRSAGLHAEEVNNEDLDILDIHRRVMAGGDGETWGNIDAVAAWEPSVSHFEREGLARSLKTMPAVWIVAVSDNFIARHPETAVQFLAALVRAWDYFSHHSDKVRQWYIDETQLGYSSESLASAARIDPNFGAKSPSEIDLNLTEGDIAALERGAVWSHPHDHPTARGRIRQAVDQGLLAKAMEEIASGQFEDIQVILPTPREAPRAELPGSYFFDPLPLWGFFVLMMMIAFLAIEFGQLLARRRRRVSKGESDGPFGTVVGAVLGLLAFVIGLTFAAASHRFDDRKEALLDDVNAIQTAYLRAGLLPEPQKTTTRTLLRDYVEVRIGMANAFGRSDSLGIVQGRAEALQRALWSHAEALAEADRRSGIYALFISSLNEVFDLHTKRVVLGAQYRIPIAVWLALLLASFLAMTAVGFQFGISGKRSLLANFVLAATLALVLQIVFDLDRPGEGTITVNQRPMIDLYRSLNQPK